MRGVCVGRTFGFTKRCQVYEPLKNSLGCNALKSGHYSLKQLFNYPSIIPQQQHALLKTNNWRLEQEKIPQKEITELLKHL